jgi:adenylate kinase family enzyme
VFINKEIVDKDNFLDSELISNILKSTFSKIEVVIIDKIPTRKCIKKIRKGL